MKLKCNKDMLSLLSGYIAVIIGAAISLFVMYKTFQNTKREHIHEYEERWLESFREKSGVFVSVFNSNHLINIINEMTVDATMAYCNCGVHINRMMDEEVKMSLICTKSNDSKLSELNIELHQYLEQYRSKFMDVHQVVCCVRNESQKRNYDKRIAYKDISDLEINENLKTIIGSNLNNDGKIPIPTLHKVLLDWIDDDNALYLSVFDALKQYIEGKQKEINGNYQKI